MYNYTPIGIYSAPTLVEEAHKNIQQQALDERPELNEIEIDFVKFLFHIRNANYNGRRRQKNHTIKYSLISGPNSYRKRERIFIGGKIFPVLNIAYNGKDANATFIRIKTLNFDELRLLFGYEDYRLYDTSYISIDNDAITIFLPPSYSGIDFAKIMLDFLTNGKNTAHTIGGEFPDYETYKLALRERAIGIKDWKGQDGCRLIKDRANNNIRWQNSCYYIVKDKIKGRLAPFAQIFDFYDAMDHWLGRLGHEVKWCKGAKKLVYALSHGFDNIGSLESGSSLIDNDVETILNELNLGICDFAIERFHDLIFQKTSIPLKGDDAYNWDVSFVTNEQQVIAPPIYKKTSKATIKKYQKMADKDGYDVLNGLSSLGGGAYVANNVTPAFDDFNPPAKVTDSLFRTDLPLLMLYLDKHKIDKNKCSDSLKNYLTLDGHINSEGKKIISPFKI